MRCSKRCWRRAARLRYHCPKHLAPPEAWNDLIERCQVVKVSRPDPSWMRQPGESAMDQKRRTGVISGTGPPPTRPPPKAPRIEP